MARGMCGPTGCRPWCRTTVERQSPSRLQSCHIEPGEMEHLLHRLGLHQPVQLGGLALTESTARRQRDLLIGDLHQTEAIAAMNQSHRFGVNRQGIRL